MPQRRCNACKCLDTPSCFNHHRRPRPIFLEIPPYRHAFFRISYIIFSQGSLRITCISIGISIRHILVFASIIGLNLHFRGTTHPHLHSACVHCWRKVANERKHVEREHEGNGPFEHRGSVVVFLEIRCGKGDGEYQFNENEEKLDPETLAQDFMLTEICQSLEDHL
jgi:hypothetical protein